jgi:hypothetical protein
VVYIDMGRQKVVKICKFRKNNKKAAKNARTCHEFSRWAFKKVIQSHNFLRRKISYGIGFY